MRVSSSLLNGVGCVVVASQLLSAAQSPKDDPWQNLGNLASNRAYTFIDRQRNCVAGEIMAVTELTITLKRWNLTWKNPSTVTLDRQKILRVTDGSQSYDLLYNGRSSWSDLQGLQGIPSGEAVVFATDDGKRHRGRLVEVSGNWVKLRQACTMIVIAKDHVSRVWYLRYKPASAGALYAAQEMVFLDPRLWPYMLHIAPKIWVLVYDSSEPEENGPVACRNNPWVP